MNENDATLAATLKQITLENQKLASSHLALLKELGALKTTILEMSGDLIDSAGRLIDLSRHAVDTTGSLHTLLQSTDNPLAIDAAQTAASAAKAVAGASLDIWAYLRSIRDSVQPLHQ